MSPSEPNLTTRNRPGFVPLKASTLDLVTEVFYAEILFLIRLNKLNRDPTAIVMESSPVQRTLSGGDEVSQRSIITVTGCRRGPFHVAAPACLPPIRLAWQGQRPGARADADL